MKLIINYDLINEITKANTGIDFKRFSRQMGIYLGTIATLDLATLALGHDINYQMITHSMIHGTLVFGIPEVFVKNINKKAAEFRLGSLASSLTDINIYTSVDSIKKARLYKTQYKIFRGDKPTLQQDKYIMLPTTGTFNADEVSLLQEHNIGSNEYILSMGEPKKADSKVYSKVFSRANI